MRIDEVRYDHPDAARLVAEVQQEYVRRYGGPDKTPVDPEEFIPPRGLFVVGYHDDEPVACGGWRSHGTDAEIKRMYVVERARRTGHARRILAELERTALEAGHVRVILETGHMQPEAVTLYRSAGYAEVAPFGIYAGEPLAIHLGKALETPVRLRLAGRVILLDPDGRVLLFRYDDDPPTKRHWATPGGGLNEGEDFIQGARREVAEETGWTDAEVDEQVVYDRTHTMAYAGGVVRQHEQFFLGRVDVPKRELGQVAAMHSSDGIAAWRWWTLAELEHTTERVWPKALPDLIRSALLNINQLQRRIGAR